MNNKLSEELKQCGDCGGQFPLLNFSSNRTNRDGKQYNCKQCCAKRNKAWRAKSLEKYQLWSL